MADIEYTIEAIDKSSSTLRTIDAGLQAFRNALNLIGQAAQIVNRVVDETVGEFVKYAQEIRTLTQLTGESTEEMSRLIQVADDYKLSVSDLTTASRKLATEGLSLDIETLARLSDEYLRLGSGAERQTFINEKLGRSGLAFTEILSQGSAAILARSESISEMLILDQEAIDKAETYRLAVDDLSDSWEALKVSQGAKMVEFATYALKTASIVGDAVQLLTSGAFSGDAMGGILAKYLPSFAAIYHGGVDAISGTTDAISELTQETVDSMMVAREYTLTQADLFDQLRSGEITFEEYATAVDKLDASVQKNIVSQTDWLLSYTDLSTASDKAASEFEMLGRGIENLGSEGAMVWQQFLYASGEIDKPALEAFVRMEMKIAKVKEMLAAGASFNVIVNYLMTGGERRPVNISGSSGGGGTTTLASWASAADIAYARAHPDIYDLSSIPAGKAGGGSFRGWAMVGDTPGGGRTPYTEYIYAPQGAMVYNQSQMSGKSAPPMAGGGFIPPAMQDINLSDLSIDKLARAIDAQMAKR